MLARSITFADPVLALFIRYMEYANLKPAELNVIISLTTPGRKSLSQNSITSIHKAYDAYTTTQEETTVIEDKIENAADMQAFLDLIDHSPVKTKLLSNDNGVYGSIYQAIKNFSILEPQHNLDALDYLRANELLINLTEQSVQFLSKKTNKREMLQEDSANKKSKSLTYSALIRKLEKLEEDIQLALETPTSDKNSAATNEESSKLYDIDNPVDRQALSEKAGFNCISADRPADVKCFVTQIKKLDRGYGVIAGESISGEEVIFLGDYLGDELNQKQFKELKNTSYVAIVKSNLFVNAEENGNFATRINHSASQPNVEFARDPKTGRLYLQTKKEVPIKKFHQYLLNYGPSFIWDTKSKENMRFLNPQDNGEESIDLLKKGLYQDHPISLRDDIANFFGYTPNQRFYVPKYFDDILKNECPANFPENPELDFGLLAIDPDTNLPLPIKKQKSITLLIIAAYLGHLNSVEWLVKQGANIDHQHSFTGHNALFTVIRSNLVHIENKEKIINYLINNSLECREPFVCKDKDGLTPLHWCIQLGYSSMIRNLIESDSSRVHEELKKGLISFYKEKNTEQLLSSMLQASQNKIDTLKVILLTAEIIKLPAMQTLNLLIAVISNSKQLFRFESSREHLILNLSIDGEGFSFPCSPKSYKEIDQLLSKLHSTAKTAVKNPSPTYRSIMWRDARAGYKTDKLREDDLKQNSKFSK